MVRLNTWGMWTLQWHTLPLQRIPKPQEAHGLGCASFVDHFCKLVRVGFLFKINAANIEIDDYKIMNKTTAQISEAHGLLFETTFANLRRGFFSR